VLTIEEIRGSLGEYAPRVLPVGQSQKAAVAVVLRDGEDRRPEVLFIKRAQHPADPWSGHMAFPGGHLDPEDTNLKAAAMRETWEEIGLDLGGAEYLGPLDHQHAMPRGRQLNMLIAPHVFELDGDPTFNANYEVDEVVWTSLSPLARGTNHDTETLLMAGKPTIFNGYRLERGHFVWGLTYRMLKSFFWALDPRWEPPAEL
jgi:8-oxo-dGTP pyrophosphatase MutT (NUDIX family)